MSEELRKAVTAYSVSVGRRKAGSMLAIAILNAFLGLILLFAKGDETIAGVMIMGGYIFLAADMVCDVLISMKEAEND